MSTAEAGHPAWCPTDPTGAESCPGCGATHGVQRIIGTSPKVQAGMCAAGGLRWATTVINPALSIVEPGTMTMTLCLPATEVISIDAMASVDTVVWRYRLCDHHGTVPARRELSAGVTSRGSASTGHQAKSTD